MSSPNLRQQTLRLILWEELMRRCEKDSKYSLRTFAKSLEMSHSFLSQIMSGKRPISKPTYQRLVNILEIDMERLSRDKSPLDESEFNQISLDHSAFRSEWYHFAVLCFLETKQPNFNPKTIAKKLGIQETQVRGSLERLRRLGLISDRAGKWYRDPYSKTLEASIPQKFSKNFHRSIADKANYSLENTKEAKQKFLTTIFSLSPEMLPELTELIQEFQNNVQRKAESSRNATEVYALSVQCFPLSVSSEDR